MIPTILLSSVGIMTLVFWRQGFDLAAGILILSFSAASIAGSIIAAVLVGRSARRAGEQSDFVSGVSHELKTPLTSIRMFAETLLLDRAADDDERKECLEHIATETERLSALVERLLDVRKLEEGRRVFAEAPVDVADVVDAAVRSQVPLLKDRGVQVECDVEDGLPALWGDREALITALANLVQNAARHGGKGRIELIAHREGKFVALRVRDHGPGIPRRFRRRIFESFFRATPAENTAKPGLGIGLAMVKHIVDAHEGRIDLDSKLGNGSEFALLLPFPKDDDDA